MRVTVARAAFWVVGLVLRAGADEAIPLELNWHDNILTVSRDDIPGGPVEIWYLEAFCRKGSTNRKWDDTVVAHTTRSLRLEPTHIELESHVQPNVRVHHDIRSTRDTVEFKLTLQNDGNEPADVEWAQPCIRVGPFTGLNQDEYIRRCFIVTDDGPTMLDALPRSTKAVYAGGQVYVPRGINPADVNPRPISTVTPLHDLIGCVSRDEQWVLGATWGQTQELFQGIIRCIHADLRVGGLAANELKAVTGRLYLLRGSPEELLKRHLADSKYPK